MESTKRCANTIYGRTGLKTTIEEMTDSFFELFMPNTKETLDQYSAMSVDQLMICGIA